MKPIINNPASSNSMWVSKMPNNFQATKRVTLTSGVGVVPTSSFTHHHQVTNNPTTKLSKSMLMKYYAEQIHPQYPFLTKAKVKAALVLADNNLHECRLFLNLKTKLVELKKPLSIPESLTTEKPPNQAVSNNLKLIVTAKNNPCDSTKATDVSRSSSVSSSVYDFSDTDTDIESPSDWFKERRANKSSIPSRKVGVLIMKCDTGYKALPL